MKIALIVAHASDYAIGVQNALPWYIPEDLKFFKRVTMGKPIIMGRNTYESIGRPLPGRTNIVITRNAEWSAPGVKVVHSLADAIRLASDVALIDGASECMIMGGGQIYQEAFPLVDRMYVTEVETEVPSADVFFPKWNREDWQVIEEAHLPYSAPERPACCFRVLDRKAPNA